MSAILEVRDLTVRFGSLIAVNGVGFDAQRGSITAVIGPSGTGKSTLIRCINRLEEHQQGTLKVDGVELTDDIKAIDQVRKDGGCKLC